MIWWLEDEAFSVFDVDSGFGTIEAFCRASWSTGGTGSCSGAN
jgi:hypothetical protein